MTLTKSQWDILATLQAFPDYRLIYNSHQAPKIIKSVDDWDTVKRLSRPAFDAIRPWLKKVHEGPFSAHYQLDPEAELTADWPAIKAKRVREQRLQAEQQQAEREAASARIVAGFLNIQLGPYRVEMIGRWPFDGEIYCGEQVVAGVHLPVMDTAWGDWNDVLLDSRVQQYLAALAEFVNRANRAAGSEAK